MSEVEPRRAIGRPRSIDRDKILAAAHRLGLENLTMRAIADELGVTTQALYNHIGGRRELLVLLANDYSELFELDVDDGASWQVWLAEFATSLRGHLQTHPGLAASVVTEGPATPAALQFVERTVAKLRASGFNAMAALRAYRIVLEFVVGWAEHHDRAGAGADRSSEPDRGSPLHDEIVAAWSSDDDELFAFGLDALLVGLAEVNQSNRPPTPARQAASNGRAGRARATG